MIHQGERAECGLACLAMILASHGRDVDLVTLRRRHPVSANGATVADLMRIARACDLNTRPLRAEPDELRLLRTPCLLHWDYDHFVVLVTVSRRRVRVHDPAIGLRWLRHEEVARHFTGVVLELTPAPGFQPGDERRRLRLSALLPGARGIVWVVAQLVAVSTLLQIVALATPYYVQLVVDDVLSGGNIDLLLVLGVGFSVIALFGVALTALRTYISSYFGALLAFQIGAGLMWHLLRLPVEWFSTRHTGDVLSRFQSFHSVRTFVTESVASLIVDGVMVAGFAAALLVYDVRLALVVFVALGLFAATRIAAFPAAHRLSQAQLRRGADTSSIFLESVRGMQGVKAFGQEGARQTRWQRCFMGEIESGLALSRLDIGVEGARGVLFGLENVLVVYLAAWLVIEGTFTVGMLYAFLAYKLQFRERAISLVDLLFTWRLLGVHLDRLAELVHARPEAVDGPLMPPRAGRGPLLEVRGVAFAYPGSNRSVFSEVSLAIAEGERLVLVGPSGSGKSTLLRIVAGLVTPTEGRIQLGGLAATGDMLRSYRAAVATLCQEDGLLAGTIAENVCFFEPSPDTGRIRACLEGAGLLEMVETLPMRLDTLIGDLGGTLSAGQQQRVLLARALYKPAALLVLDEATSNLDGEAEERFYRALADDGRAALIVTHRATALRHAHRMVRLAGGKLEEVSPSQSRNRGPIVASRGE